MHPHEPPSQERHPLAAAAARGCLAAAAAAALLLGPCPAEAKELIQGYPKVVDGDTLDFSGTRVRLFGIDAPGGAQRGETHAQRMPAGGHRASTLAALPACLRCLPAGSLPAAA